MEMVATCSTTDGSAFMSVYVYVIATVVPQLTAMAVTTHPRHRISKRWHVADIKNFTGYDQATLTVDRNSTIYFVYVYKIATNTLRRQLRGWWRLPKIAQTARSRRQTIARKDQDRSKFRKYENVCLRNQAKRLEKFLFAATNDAAIDGIVHCFLPTITRNGFCSHLRKIISRQSLTP